MKVSVVILNWNGEKMLEEYLPNILSHCNFPGVEVVIIDNGSTDNSVCWLQVHYPEVRLVILSENYGFADGYNKGLEAVDSEYIVLLNSDIQLTEGWLSPLIDFLDNHPDYAACQPKMLSLRQPEYFEHAGACGGFIDYYGYPYCRGRIMNTVERDQGQYDVPIDVAWTSGAAMCLRNQAYREVGQLDGTFFAHMEEIDLCWRLRARGYKLRCIPQSVVYHLGGGSLPYGSPRKTYLNFRNNLLMLYKNLPEGDLCGVMRMRCLLDYLAAGMFFFKGQWAHMKAVLKARKDGKSLIHKQYKSVRQENLRLAVKGAYLPKRFPRLILLGRPPFHVQGN